METFPILSIALIYFAVAFMKPFFQNRLPFNICSICISVSTTWLLLLVLWILGYPVSMTVLAVLMGMSVTGIMYKTETIYKKQKIKHFWFVRLIIILGGYFSITNLLQKQWSVFSLVVILSILLIAIVSFLIQGTTHAEALEEVKKKKTLIQKLEDCC